MTGHILPAIRTERPWLAHVLAIGLALCGYGVRVAMGDALVGYPYLTFVPPIVAAALLLGPLPATVCAAVSGALANYFFVSPPGTIVPQTTSDAVALLLYAFMSATIILPIAAMRAAQARAEAAEAALRALNVDLENRVRARTDELMRANQDLARALEGVREAEAKVHQLQKMESVGRLTGGIAHDFNNMLAIIVGSLEMAQRRLAAGRSDIERYIANGLDGAQRASRLTRSLLAYARRQPLEPNVLDVNRLVAETSEMLRRTLGEKVDVECVLAGGLWRAFVDPAQLESALMNLAVNARDAMPKGGKLTIETANASLDESYAERHVEVQPGQYVMIAVTDTGLGMTPDIAEKAFEPFFTTKPTGEGTGLGLAQVFGFVKQSHGHAKIYSEPGHGTSVRLYLPRAEAAAEPETRAPRAVAAGHECGDETILVVEDDADVRRTSTEMLRELGYRVVEAADGEAALALLAGGQRVDLVFTDVVMPGLGGRQLADRIAADRPGLPVLYTTGYTRNAIVHNGTVDAGVELITKPFTIDQLGRRVRALLERTAVGRERAGRGPIDQVTN
jgi:signal transduction histidine kinase/ActR/RegA family two-component response regulator